MPWINNYFYEYRATPEGKRKRVYVGAKSSPEAQAASARETLWKQHRHEHKEGQAVLTTLLQQFDQLRHINAILFRYALIENGHKKRKSEIRRLPHES